MRNSGALIQPAIKRASTGKLISAFYLEIEYLLDRVERSSTHYQTLGLERSATNEEVVHAYQQTVALLHPSYYKVRAAVPDELLVRIDKIFTRVSQALLVLTNPDKRIDYDRSLQRAAGEQADCGAVKPPEVGDLRAENLAGKIAREMPLQETPAPAKPAAQKTAAQKTAAAVINIKSAHVQQVVYTKPANAEGEVNRRRCERFKLTVPALVAGYERANGKWQEVAKTIDVSRVGVAVRMRKRMRYGSVVHVTLPLPLKLRSHGFSEPGYNMYAIVRRVERPEDGFRIVGLEFLGAHPPAGYLYTPWASFRTQKWAGAERRREPRIERAEPVMIQFLNEAMQVIGYEMSVTENLSPGGARVIIKSDPPDFDMAKVTGLKRRFESIALLRNRFTGEDNSERICLQFVDNKWPM